ncbi:MAG: efflux RND transporter periplasmic adaptor subunit [Polyangiaceae bacterium]|nr:efflux RND transporter periplasmic adaptor subunit [Polyangiaceae bacterium]
MAESTAKAAPAQRSSELENALELGAVHKRRRTVFRIIWGLVISGLIAGGVFFATKKPPAEGPRYDTAEVRRGDLHVTVTATGTLSALDSVQVGAEISGRVVKVLVDINDKVKEGEVLAEIDPEQYRAKRDEAAAQLAAANASKLTAIATANESELKAARLRSMQDAGLASTQELEAAEATLARANASVKSSAAQLTSAAASLKAANTSLSKTIIRSPIDGVVLERSVEPGQTVTSGLQTPVLFTLAADLSEMLLAVKVDEADVGQVKSGQRATFTVDAYPNRTFESTVVLVKNMPTTTQNVVTYETRLSVKNDEGLLRPGMTATATIMVDDRSGVLLVPNAALRFSPKERSAPAASATASSKGFSVSSMFPRRPRGNRSSSSGATAKPQQRQKPKVFVLRGNSLERVPVEMGATDGINTAISGPGIEPGVRVVIAEAAAKDG